MISFYAPLFLVIAGMILYHVAQKSVPPSANPFVTMVVAYALGMVACALCSFIFPAQRPFLTSVREANWAAYAIGIGAATIEIGFLLSYRAGWNLGVAPIVASVAVTLLLVPIGVVAFREHLSALNIAGVVFCIVGLLLVTHK
jgi:drug/metabolite transporter (DMT)-like permease